MVTQSFVNPLRVKLKFFLAYAVSVGLIVLIVLSLTGLGPDDNGSSTKASVASGNTYSFAEEENTVLQDKMQALSKAYLANTNIAGNEKPAAVVTAEIDMQEALDNLKVKIGENPQGQEKAQNILSFYETTVSHQSQLYSTLLQNRQDTETASSPSNDAELQQLKGQLTEKEQQIELLQTSLREKPTVTTSSSPDEAKEWRTRAANLETENAKLTKQIDNLNASYKIVAEDNRRLLSRLQASTKQ